MTPRDLFIHAGIIRPVPLYLHNRYRGVEPVFVTDDIGRTVAARDIFDNEALWVVEVVRDNERADPVVREWVGRALGRMQ